MLEIVEQQQRLPVADQRGHPVGERPPPGLLHVQRLRDRRHELGGIGDIGQRHEGDAVEKLRGEQAPELDERARLPDSAWPGDRDDPVVTRELDERIEVAGSTDQRPDRLRQVARQAREALAFPFERPGSGTATPWAETA